MNNRGYRWNRGFDAVERRIARAASEETGCLPGVIDDWLIIKLDFKNGTTSVIDVRADNETLLAALDSMANSDDISRLSNRTSARQVQLAISTKLEISTYSDVLLRSGGVGGQSRHLDG